MMTEIKKLTYLLRDFPLFVLVGISAGILGYAFRQSIAWAGTVRYQYPKLIFLLPFAAILVTALYRLILSGYKNGPKTVIKAVRDNGKINSVQLPLVFLASCLTHLTGGSAGRLNLEDASSPKRRNGSWYLCVSQCKIACVRRQRSRVGGRGGFLPKEKQCNRTGHVWTKIRRVLFFATPHRLSPLFARAAPYRRSTRRESKADK